MKSNQCRIVRGPSASWRSLSFIQLRYSGLWLAHERLRILSEANFPRRLCMVTAKAVTSEAPYTNPLTIRIDLDRK